MRILISLLILSSFKVYSFPRGIPSEPFEVRVYTLVSTKAYALAQAQLKVAQDVNQCRGAFIAIPQNKWDCKANKKSPNRLRCLRTYQCSRISKKLNRITQITSAKKSLSRLKPVDTENFRIVIPSREKLALETGAAAEKRRQLEEWKRLLKEKELEEKKRLERVARLKDILPEEEPELAQENEILEFLKSEGLSPDDIRDDDDIKAFLKREKVSEDVVFRDYDPFTEEDVKWSLQTTIEPDGMTKIYKLRRVVDGQTHFMREFHWLKGTVSMVEVSSLDDSIRTTNVSWTPAYLISERWILRGNAGMHFIEQTDGTNSNSFSLMEIGLYPQYHRRQFFYEAGMGYQLWNNATADKYLYTTFGMGYVFEIPMFKYIDRLFANYTLVGNPDSNKEFKLGVGFSF